MLLNAKYAGRCRRCGDRFPAGTRIEWTKRDGARHAVDDRHPPGRFGTGCLGLTTATLEPHYGTDAEAARGVGALTKDETVTAGYVAGALGEEPDWLAPVTVRRGVGALPVW